MRIRKVYFTYGPRQSQVFDFTSETTMNDIHNRIQQAFGDDLPTNFSIQFYTDQANFRDLDEDLLQSNENPFRINSIDANNFLQLFIVRPSPLLTINQTNPPSNTLLSTNDMIDDDILERILSPGFLANSNFLGNVDSAILLAPFLPTSPNEDATRNNISSDEEIVSQLSNEYQLATETEDEQSRISFSHDVHPNQKHHYISDKYNVQDGTPTNGDLPCLQGWKTTKQIDDGESILPELQMPQFLCQLNDFTLFFYAVYEEMENDTRIWYQHHRKGFLFVDDLTSDAVLQNPLIIPVNKDELTGQGIFRLKVLLLTDLEKKKKIKTEIYRLSDEKTRRIHPAETVIVSRRVHLKPTRALCVPVINNRPIWPQFALSDFIQPSSRTTRSSPALRTTVPSFIESPTKKQKLN